MEKTKIDINKLIFSFINLVILVLFIAFLVTAALDWDCFMYGYEFCN